MTTPTARPLVLVAAGTDPSGGAGLPADLRVLDRAGCWGLGVTTAVVVQSTRGVERFVALDPALVVDQWRAVVDDVGAVAAIKLGMLASAAIVRALAPALRDARAPIVCDPVLAAGHGTALSDAALLDALRSDILPVVTLLTPNAPEAERLLGWPPGRIADEAAMIDAAGALVARGCRAVLLKGGHVPGAPGDVLADAARTVVLPNDTIAGLDVHGTGCQLASLIAAALAGGADVPQAVSAARATFARWLRDGRWRPGLGREILDGDPCP